MQSFHQENWVNPTVPTVTVPSIATSRTHASVPSMTFANVTQVLSDKTVWETGSACSLVAPGLRPQLGPLGPGVAPRFGHERRELQRAAGRRGDVRPHHGEGRPQSLSAGNGSARIITSGPARRSSGASIDRRMRLQEAVRQDMTDTGASKTQLKKRDPWISGGRFNTWGPVRQRFHLADRTHHGGGRASGSTTSRPQPGS